VAFAVPVNTRGVKMVLSPFSETTPSEFHHPISTHHKIVDTLTFFDDVFVPWDRVFLDGEWEYAGAHANTFVQFHRFTAASYKLPWIDLMVGAAYLMAEMNGIARANHVREKLSRLVHYRETVLALTKMSAIQCRLLDGGIAVPDPVLSNAAKLHFAENYHSMVRAVQDIAGGLLVTGPAEEDLANPETGPDLEKYLGAKKGVSTMDRLRLMNLIRDMMASEFGGYHEILTIHAEGSLETQKITMAREFNPKAVIDFVRRCANLSR
jgi:aromatic ring hydroxylase